MTSALAREASQRGAPAGQDGRNGEPLDGGYGGGVEMPLEGYATLVGLYNALFAGFLAATWKLGRPLPERLPLSDILLLGVATHKLRWWLAKDRVTSPLRAPFTRFEKPGPGPADVTEQSRGAGMQRAIGDLFTCPWCMAAWVGAFLAYGLVLAPRVTRLIAATFAAISVADFIHHGYDALQTREG